MKITDYAEVQAEAQRYLDNVGSDLQEVFDDEDLVQLITDAYHYNDSAVEVTWRIKNKPTVIITTYRVSIIYDGASSYYKSKFPLCVYESLESDIENLYVTIEAAYARYQVQTA